MQHTFCIIYLPTPIINQALLSQQINKQTHKQTNKQTYHTFTHPHHNTSIVIASAVITYPLYHKFICPHHNTSIVIASALSLHSENATHPLYHKFIKPHHNTSIVIASVVIFAFGKCNIPSVS